MTSFDCLARASSEEDVVEVAILHVLDERQARMELDLYLRVWHALHPGVRVDVIRDS